MYRVPETARTAGRLCPLPGLGKSKGAQGSTLLTHPDWTPGRKVQKERPVGLAASRPPLSPPRPSRPGPPPADHRLRVPSPGPRSVPVAPARDTLQGVRVRLRGDIRAPGSSSRRHLQAPAATREAPPPTKRGGSLEWRPGSGSRAPSRCDSARGPCPPAPGPLTKAESRSGRAIDHTRS